MHLESLQSGAAPWTGLSGPARGLLDVCIDSAKQIIHVLSSLQEQSFLGMALSVGHFEILKLPSYRVSCLSALMVSLHLASCLQSPTVHPRGTMGPVSHPVVTRNEQQGKCTGQHSPRRDYAFSRHNEGPFLGRRYTIASSAHVRQRGNN